MKKENIYEVCPHCGSTDVEYASMVEEPGTITGFGLPEKYFCKRCGYRGSVILEMSKNDIRRTNFSKKLWVNKNEKIDYRSVEIFKPVFITISIVFLITSFMLLVPAYDFSVEPISEINYTQLGSITTLPSGKEIYIMKSGEKYVPYGEKYLKLSESPFTYVENALGLKNVQGFLVPVFFLFFISGLFVLMIYSHWHRIRFFTN